MGRLPEEGVAGNWHRNITKTHKTVPVSLLSQRSPCCCSIKRLSAPFYNWRKVKKRTRRLRLDWPRFHHAAPPTQVPGGTWCYWLAKHLVLLPEPPPPPRCTYTQAQWLHSAWGIQKTRAKKTYHEMWFYFHSSLDLRLRTFECIYSVQKDSIPLKWQQCDVFGQYFFSPALPS